MTDAPDPATLDDEAAEVVRLVGESADAPDEPDESDEPRRSRAVFVLPSLVTLAGTFCGFLAIAYVLDAGVVATKDGPDAAYAKIASAGWLIFLAMIFDGLDGRVARIGNATSEFGIQLDSLSDAISFGVAPAILAKGLFELRFDWVDRKITLLCMVLFAVCGVLRLARYNSEDADGDAHHEFRGLPIPGAAGVIAAIAVVSAEFAHPSWLLGALPLLGPILGILMISRFRYVHGMNRYLRGSRSFIFFVLTAFLVAVTILLEAVGPVLLVVFGVYAFSGPAWYLFRRFGKDPDQEPIFD